MSYVAMLLVIIACYYISIPKLRGQWIMLAAHFFWLMYSTDTQQVALLIQSYILIIITARAIFSWSKKGIKL